MAGQAGQGRSGQGKTEQDLALVGTIRHAKTRQSSQGRTGRAGQGRARHNRTWH